MLLTRAKNSDLAAAPRFDRAALRSRRSGSLSNIAQSEPQHMRQLHSVRVILDLFYLTLQILALPVAEGPPRICPKCTFRIESSVGIRRPPPPIRILYRGVPRHWFGALPVQVVGQRCLWTQPSSSNPYNPDGKPPFRDLIQNRFLCTRPGLSQRLTDLFGGQRRDSREEIVENLKASRHLRARRQAGISLRSITLELSGGGLIGLVATCAFCRSR